MLELINLLSRLQSEGDVAAIAAAVPALQTDLAALGDDIVRLGNRVKKIAADCAPIVGAAHKVQVALALPAPHSGGVDTGPGFDGHSGP